MGGKRLNIPKKKLEELYLDQKMSIKQVAGVLGCSIDTVTSRLKEYNIPIRSPKERNLKADIPKEKLEELYLDQKMTIKQVAGMLGCDIDTIMNRMKKYNISSRSHKERNLKVDISKEKLEELYLDQKLSSIKIGREKFNCDPQTILNKLKKYNIPIKSSGEYRKGKTGIHLVCKVSKEKLEKLYLKQKLSAREIGELLGCSEKTILQRLKEYNIEIKSPKERNWKGEDISKEKLENWYLEKKLSTYQISKKVGCSKISIHNKLKKYDIPIRPPKENNSIHISHLNIWNDKEKFKNWMIEFQKSYNRKCNYNDIMKYFNCTHCYVHKKIHKYGLEEYYDYESNISAYQIIVEDWLKNNGVGFIREFQVSKFRYDLKVEDKEVLIEVNPTFTHRYDPYNKLGIKIFGNCQKERDYHLRKLMVAEKKGFRLVMLFEKDLEDLDKYLGFLLERKVVGASKCKLVKDINLKDFLESNHRQGGNGWGYGLVYKGELIAGIVFKKSRNRSSGDYELFRLCFKKGWNVKFGSERLFKNWMKDNGWPSVVSYCDLTYNVCKVYEKLGFVLDHVAEPNYKWVKNDEWCSRESCQRHKLQKRFGKEEYGDRKELGEVDIMEMEGYVRVYDCGNKVFIYDQKKERKKRK